MFLDYVKRERENIWMGVGVCVQDRKSMRDSVARFGEISPLWQKVFVHF